MNSAVKEQTSRGMINKGGSIYMPWALKVEPTNLLRHFQGRDNSGCKSMQEQGV